MSAAPVKIIEPDATSLSLQSAILLYSSGRGDVYATVHAIDTHPEQPERRLLGAGIPASKSALAAFAAAVSDATSFTGMIPERLLYTAPNAIAWWLPSQARRVWFKSTDPAIGSVSAVVTHPPLFFLVANDAWYIAALADNKRPIATTKLYKAPYFNVWDGNEICTGNVGLPSHTSPDAIKAYENAFFRSNFTHPNQTKLVKYPGDATALWSAQLRDPEQILLTADILQPTKETIAQFIARATTEKSR